MKDTFLKYEKFRKDFGESSFLDELVDKKIKRMTCLKSRYAESFFSILIFFSLAFLGFYVANKYGERFEVMPRDIGYVAAALIAGLVSFYVSESNKEGEINKHRQEWCKELRNILSEYVSVINKTVLMIASGGNKYADNNPSRAIEKLYSNMQVGEAKIERGGLEIEKYKNMIGLYLINGDGSKIESRLYKEVDLINRSFMEYISNIQKNGNIINSGGLVEDCEDELERIRKRGKKISTFLVPELILKSKVYFDNEWHYVKRGRLFFRVKRVFIISTAGFIVSSFLTYLMQNGSTG